jgi:MFS transporter
MAYFRNATVNLLNLHYGIHAVAFYGGGAFYFVFLLKAGLPVPLVLGAFAAILLGRFALRPMVVPLAIRFGLRQVLIVGTLLSALQYTMLAQVHGVGWPLAALLLFSALSDTIYWSTYHAYFAAVGDSEHRGSQVSAREAVAAVVGIVAPLVTGWALVAYGPQLAFGATTLILLLAALPLARTPDVAVARHAAGAWRAALPGVKLFVADGWIAAGYLVVWQIALFLSLGENYLAYGGALAVAALVGAVSGLVLGRHIDAGHGGRAVWIAFAGLVLVTLLRAGAPGHVGLAVFANALGALEYCLYVPTIMTAVYNQAKRSPCMLRFQVAAEGGWDIGGASGCLVAALLAYLHVPLSAGILLALLGVAALFLMLRRYYAQNPHVVGLQRIDLAHISPLEP